MLITAGILLSLPALCQEPSSVPGAYRGPEEQHLLEQTAKNGQIAAPGTLVFSMHGGWDRWEFWYERERDLLFRGEPDFPARAVSDDGTYGDQSWALDRQELVMTSMPLLLEALTNDQPSIREAAALSLGRIGYPASVSFLERATKDPVESVRQAAFMALGLVASDDSTKLLTTTFKTSEEDSTRAFAALGLGLSGRAEAASTLRSYLNRVYAGQTWASQEELVIGALLGAGVHGSADLNSTVLKLAEVWRKDQGNQHLLTTSIHTLGALRNPNSRIFLQEILTEKRPDLVEAAVQALGRLGDRQAIESLTELAKDSNNPRIDSAVMLSLGRLGGMEAEKALKELAPRRQEEESVRSAYVLACGMIKATGSYPQMLATFVHGSHIEKKARTEANPRRDEDALRGAAAIALGLYGNPKAATKLGSILQDKNQEPGLRGYIATSLGMLRSNKSVELLLVLAADPTLPVATRRGLATGLSLCQRETTNEQLVKMLLNDEDDSVRFAAARALASARSASSFQTLADALRSELNQDQVSAQSSHLILGLGFLGDRHVGATIGSLISGTDLREAPPLLHALRAY